MANLTRSQLYGYAEAAGFTGSALDEVVAIAFAESGGDPTHKNVNGSSTATVNGQTVNVPAGTVDRGILQINDWWNNGSTGHGALVDDACAFDPTCSFKWAYKVTGGKQPSSSSDPFKPYWVTVQNAAYKQYLTPGWANSNTVTMPSGTSSATSSGTSSATSSGTSSATSSGTPAGQQVTTPAVPSPLGLVNGSGAYSLAGGTSDTGTPAGTNTGPATSSGSDVWLILAGVVVAAGAIIAFIVWRDHHHKEEESQDVDTVV
jgi:hypothetical protein